VTSRLVLPERTTCAPAEAATVTYRLIDRNFPRDGGHRDHYVSFTAVAPLTNVLRIESGPTSFDYRLPNYSGTGAGIYRETMELVADDCTRNIVINGNASLEVRVQTTIAEVNVTVRGTNLARTDNATSACGAAYTGVEDGPVYGPSCNFFDVDLQNGGRYKSDDSSNFSDDDDQYDVACTLDLGPLKFQKPPEAQGKATGSPQDGRPGAP
jgi:hypothetical protein